MLERLTRWIKSHGKPETLAAANTFVPPPDDLVVYPYRQYLAPLNVPAPPAELCPQGREIVTWIHWRGAGQTPTGYLYDLARHALECEPCGRVLRFRTGAQVEKYNLPLCGEAAFRLNHLLQMAGSPYTRGMLTTFAAHLDSCPECGNKSRLCREGQRLVALAQTLASFDSPETLAVVSQIGQHHETCAVCRAATDALGQTSPTYAGGPSIFY